MKILDIQNLHVHFTLHKDVVHALQGISFSLNEKEIIGIVGESGSGKSISMQCLVKLLPNSAKYVKGKILFEDVDLFKIPKKNMGFFRGKIAYIFQDPMTSLNPTMKIGKQILESLKIKSKKKVYELLHLVGIDDPQKRFSEYPHQFSGGQRQRIGIAIALAMNPKILIADEPTTALDVTIQSQIIDLLKKIQRELKTSIIFISHDIKLVASLASQILVMYAGKIIEKGPVDLLIKNPKHPYTKLLLESVPNIKSNLKKLKTIKGSPPDILKKSSFCSFAPRCPFAKDICFQKTPPCFLIKNQEVSCFLYEAV